MDHIPIVFATDNNYIPLVVALESLMKNVGSNTFYDIYILIDDSFFRKSQEYIGACFDKYQGRFSLKFINIGNVFDNAQSRYAEITRPTFYRLALPDLLKEDKCIYLDTDTIIMFDMQELYNISLENCYVAGVKHPGFILSSGKYEYCKEICIPDMEQYINAGVLVMNLKKMRKDDVVSKFLELIPKNLLTQDQDIINLVCYGKISFLPLKYNVMTKCSDWRIKDYQNLYSEEELKEAWNRPCIIHYADIHKPWNSPNCVFIDYWWNMCRKSSIFKNFINDFFKDFFMNTIYSFKGEIFVKKMPEIFDITFQRKYVIYGAGKRARAFILFLKQLGINPEFIIVSELDNNPSEVEGIEVKCINNVFNMLYDKTIIIATRTPLHNEIIKSLQRYDYLELLPVSDDWKG